MSNRNHNRNNNNNNHNEPRDEPLSMDAESSETGDTTSTAANNNILYESMAAPSAAVNNNNVAEIPVDIRTGIPIRNRHANANARSVSALAVMNHQAMLRLQSPPVACGRSTSLTGTAAGTGAGAAGMNPSLNSNNNLRAATLRLDDLNLNLNHNNNNNNNNNNHSNVIPEQDVALLEFPTDGGDSSSCSSSNNNAGWSIVETNGGTPPSARSLHAAAYLNGIYYVFGGYDGVQRVNTFHAFSFAEKRWSPVLPSSNVGVTGTGGAVGISTPPPSPRDRHVAVAFGNSFYVHGGFDGTSRVSDFWGFDFSSMTWREVVVSSGRAPSPRHSHAAVVHRHSLFIFGGYDGSYKSDLHEFDFTLSQWSAVPAAGRRPRARYRATAVVHKNTMILYGGHDGTRHLSDTHLFDFDTKIWSALITEGTPPIPRDSHVSVSYANSMYVFGGSSGSAMNDLHELQLPPNPSVPAKWRPVKTSGTEQPCHRFCHVAVSYNEAMFVFGGYDGSERLNDFIRFDFAVYDLSFEVPPSTIVADFRAMVDEETLSDVTFIVEGTPVYAHKLMLMRCSYFHALFLGQMRESKMSTIRIEQVSHSIFLQVLEYLYTDQLKIPFESAMELFEAADLFCIHRLKTMCEKRMLQSINIENAAAIFHAADMHSANALRQKTKKYVLSHFEAISKTACFEEMGRSNIELVFELLQSR